MNQHYIATELAVEGARTLLASTGPAHLAYVGPDGAPRVAPVGFYWTGTTIVVSTATTAPKVAALTARPEVSVAIDGGNTPETAQSLSIRGRAEITIVDGIVPEYLAAARSAMDDASYAGFETAVRAMYPQMARIAITPTWVRFYDYGVGRMPKFLLDLAARSGFAAEA